MFRFTHRFASYNNCRATRPQRLATHWHRAAVLFTTGASVRSGTPKTSLKVLLAGVKYTPSDSPASSLLHLPLLLPLPLLSLSRRPPPPHPPRRPPPHVLAVRACEKVRWEGVQSKLRDGACHAGNRLAVLTTPPTCCRRGRRHPSTSIALLPGVLLHTRSR